MVLVFEEPDGNYRIEFDWAIPEVVTSVEPGDLASLRDELVRLLGPGDLDGR